MILRNLYSSFIIIVLFLAISFTGNAQTRVRTEVNFPDIPGYVTLKCDFHTHTVFSDGSVWPPVRSEEAWREGLDAFSITDHIEFQPKEEDIPTNHNRSFELALPSAELLNLILIPGTEITRDMPPGHFNVLFMEDANVCDKEDHRDAIQAAIGQGAFVIWNHPGWQQANEIPIWYDEHTEIYKNGWMHGMEIVNERSYYPLAHQWCLDKGITMFGNSDIHDPVNLFFDLSQDGIHRALTLVFAKERSADSIKEALFERRTAVYFENLLIGEEQYLEPIYTNTVSIKNPEITIKGDGSAHVQIHNASDIDYTLTANGKVDGLRIPADITLYAGKTILLHVRGVSETRSGIETFSIPYTVKNLLVEPDKGLSVNINIAVTFIPEK
ncbi:Sb-PDE family phosphodiesterase [candidate division KSB1 bacterium]